MTAAQPRPDPRLLRLLGGPSLAALRKRLRRHFERAEAIAPPALLRLNSLSTTEHEALALLTGRPPRAAQSISIDVGSLDAKLRAAGLAESLRDALEQLEGPIVNPASARAEQQARWFELTAGCRNTSLTNYLERPAALGLLKRLARQDAQAAARLIERADAVLRQLPANGIARAQLAAQTLGNAHALDGGEPIAALVLAVLRHGQTRPPAARAPTHDDDDRQDERAREVWARAGVLVNELARPALVLNLPVDAAQAPHSRLGEPGYLSLRQLLRSPSMWAVADRLIFVCENPNLLAIAADQLGEHCAPLVCTDGMPAAAQRTLLAQLRAAGARLRYHGDFDWAGLGIGNHVMRAFGAEPWRFARSDYEAAVARAPHTERDLVGDCVAANWDAELAASMNHHGLAIPEEALAASLLPDLAR